MLCKDLDWRPAFKIPKYLPLAAAIQCVLFIILGYIYDASVVLSTIVLVIIVISFEYIG